MKNITYFTYDDSDGSQIGIFTFRARNGILFDKRAKANALNVDLKKSRISQLRTLAGNLKVPSYKTITKSQLIKACESRIKFKNGTAAQQRRAVKKRRSSRKRVSKKQEPR